MRIRWSIIARADLADIRRYLAEENPAAARRVAGRIRRAARQLESFPLSAMMLSGQDIRAAAVRNTAYRLIYAIAADEVLILRVWHGARQWPPSA